MVNVEVNGDLSHTISSTTAAPNATNKRLWMKKMVARNIGVYTVLLMAGCQEGSAGPVVGSPRQSD